MQPLTHSRQVQPVGLEVSKGLAHDCIGQGIQPIAAVWIS